jgi:hypothetical protein
MIGHLKQSDGPVLNFLLGAEYRNGKSRSPWHS